MITDYDFKNNRSGFSEMKKSDLGEQLATLQRQCNYLNIPVLILIDGWESSGRGYIISDLIKELDPRNFRVHIYEENKDKPFLWELWKDMPMKGKMSLFAKSYYSTIMRDLNIDKDILEQNLKSIENVEKMLYDDDVIILKFFINISEKTQKKTIEEYLKDKNKDFLVNEYDLEESKNYKQYELHFDDILTKTNFKFASWNVVSSEDRATASRVILGESIKLIQKGIDRFLYKREGHFSYKRSYDRVIEYVQKLDLNLKLTESEYSKKIKILQEKAGILAYEAYKKKIACVLVFEGMDAAGKGGAIKRITRKIDPRGYFVSTTAAPNEYERKYNYMWRFYKDFPSKGNMVIFDRSWYGRLMVERIEKFAKIEEWDRAFDEINNIEKEWANSGAVIIKYFLCIDKDEQLRRFKEREADKYFKITEEDWRNRDKWDDYLLAINEMIDRTSTEHAPWILVEGNDKKYARIKVLENFVKILEERLKEEE